MALSDVFKKAAQTAANVFSSVFKEVRYQAHGDTAYNVSTGLTEDFAEQHMVTMLFETYQNHEMDGARVLPTDVKATIPQLNLPPRPTLHDTVHVVEAGVSVVYEIMGCSQDPAEAVWELQLRRP